MLNPRIELILADVIHQPLQDELRLYDRPMEVGDLFADIELQACPTSQDPGAERIDHFLVGSQTRRRALNIEEMFWACPVLLMSG